MKPELLAEPKHDQEPESPVTMSSIWDDAGAIPPVLDAVKLRAYLTGNPVIVNAEEPISGLTALARALLSGNAATVELLLDN
jgi:hypothetical protein